MKKYILFLIMLICSTGKDITTIAAPDSSNQQVNSANSDDIATSDEYMVDDNSPGIFTMFMILMAFVFVCIGMGIVIMVLILLIVAALISAGILSVSVITAIYSRSVASGFKMLIVLISATGGIVVCGAGLWLLNTRFLWMQKEAAIFTGAATGLLAGLIFGLIAYHILRWMAVWGKNKLLRN